MGFLAETFFIHMPKTKAQKSEIVEKLGEKLKKAKVLIFTSFSRRGGKGLDFKAMEGLKRDLKGVDSEYVVLKKTLFDLVLQRSSFSEKVKASEVEGSLGVLFGYGDMLEPLKVLNKLARANKAVSIYLGLKTENKEVMSKDILVELADLPSREVLLGRLAEMVRYPLSGLANVLQGNIRGLANALTSLTQVKKLESLKV